MNARSNKQHEEAARTIAVHKTHFRCTYLVEGEAGEHQQVQLALREHVQPVVALAANANGEETKAKR